MSNIIKFESSELSAIEESKAKKIKATFEPMAKMLENFEGAYNEIISESTQEITQDLTSRAKRLRLDIGKVRIETGKLKDKQKEYIKLEDKAIMGVHNILVWAVTEKEDKLKEIENYFEIQESKRLEKLQESRVLELSKYVVDAEERDLSSMDCDVWEAYFQSKKKAFEDEQAAIKQAEKERIERERKQKLHDERKESILHLWQFVLPELRDIDFSEVEDWNAFVDELNKSKSKHDKEQERIRKENERLQKEVEKQEKKRQEELQAQEAERKRLEKEAEQKKERRRLKAIQFLLDNDFSNAHGGMELVKYNWFIGAQHYSDFDSDKEFDSFCAETLKSIEASKAQAEKEKAIELLKQKEEAEQKAKEEVEAAKQAELNKGDADKVNDLINDLKSLKTKYSFKSAKNKKMYENVNGLLDKVVDYIESK